MAVPLVTGIAALIYAYSDKYYDCKTLKLKVLESTKDDKYLPNAIASTGIISMEQAYENSIS